MDFIAYPENVNVPSNVMRGSMAVQYEELPEMIHAVARDDDGQINAVTACKRLPVRFPPDQVEHVPWQGAPMDLRCEDCGRATGFMVRDRYTGEVVVPGRPY